MSVPTTTSKVQYTLSAAVMALPVTFYFLDNAHVKAIRARAGEADYIMVLGTDYTLTGVGDEAGGTLTTIATNLEVGDIITIKRDVPITQLTNYVYNDKFPAEVHEKVADKLTMEIQQLKEVVDRAVQFPESEVAGTGNIMPAAASRAAKLFGFDATGNAVQLYDPISGVFTNGDGIMLTTVAALKAVTVGALSNGYIASVAGYASPGDGGGGLFAYVSASAETESIGIIVSPNVGAGRWKRIYSGPVSVKWYGAKGDGVNDDTAAIQLAIDSGRNVYFPNGTYSITTIAVASGQKLFGDGPDKTTIVSAETATYAITVNGAVSNVHGFELANVTVSAKFGLRLNTPLVDPAPSRYLLAAKVTNVIFYGRYSSDFGAHPDALKGTDYIDAVGVLRARNLFDASFVPATYRASLVAFGVGIGAAHCYNAEITNCKFDKLGVGVWLWSSDICAVKESRFVECGLSSVCEYNATPNEGSQNKYINNDIIAHQRAGNILLISARFTTIENNYFETYTDAACHIIDWIGLGTTIENNRIDDPQNVSGGASASVPVMMFYRPVDCVVINNKHHNFVYNHTVGIRLIQEAAWQSVDNPKALRWLGNRGPWRPVSFGVSMVEENVLPGLITPTNIRSPLATTALANHQIFVTNEDRTAFKSDVATTLMGRLLISGATSKSATLVFSGKLVTAATYPAFTLKHVKNGGTLIQTILVGSMTNLVDGSYGFHSVKVAFTEAPRPTDEITVEWEGIKVYLSSVALQFDAGGTHRNFADATATSNPYTVGALTPLFVGEIAVNTGTSPKTIWIATAMAAAAASWTQLN